MRNAYKIKEILIKLEIFFSCAIFMKNSNIIDSIDQYKCPHNDEEKVKILDIYIKIQNINIGVYNNYNSYWIRGSFETRIPYNSYL